MKNFEFVVEARSRRARAGRLSTPHGEIRTPIFMPVGTAGSVKGLTSTQLEEIGAQIILANTYHMHVRPGEDLVQELGGLHGFAGFHRPFLTEDRVELALRGVRPRREVALDSIFGGGARSLPGAGNNCFGHYCDQCLGAVRGASGGANVGVDPGVVARFADVLSSAAKTGVHSPTDRRLVA